MISPKQINEPYQRILSAYQGLHGFGHGDLKTGIPCPDLFLTILKSDCQTVRIRLPLYHLVCLISIII